jgi:toxin HigB-1
MDKTYVVDIEKFAEKQLKKLPHWIREALLIWVETIENFGIQAMRKIPGYHDEILRGQRSGQRSSRLSRGYRVIYEEREGQGVTVVAVLEVNKHEY